jgi:hypothetical protein
MIGYLIRRFILALFTVVAISILSFAIIQLPPGDYVDAYIAQMSASGSAVSQQENGMFQTAAFQIAAGFSTGTQVRTILRFSPEATVFAIDPFAGRLGVYDPSLSIQVTQELPSFGLPVRAEAILDARNLLDAQTSSENGEVLTFFGNTRRSVRGGISVRF